MTSQKQSTVSASLQPGDVIGFAGKGIVSDIINIGTFALPRWGLSHVAIVARHAKLGKLLYESTTFNDEPCVIQGKLFAGTQAQHLDKILKSNCRVWHYPLRLKLREWESNGLTEYLNKGIGVPYDEIGAVRSGGHLFSRFESMLHGENRARIFCSEWCAAALQEIERFDTDNVSQWNPNSFCRELRRRAIVLKPVRLK